jgi:hypothetical protein
MARNTSPQRLSELVSTIPLGRLAGPDEVAAVVCSSPRTRRAI